MLAYIDWAGLPDMTINARVISGLDPGAVPGGSTISSHSSPRKRESFSWGRHSFDRRLKTLAFVRVGPVKGLTTVIANDNSAEEFALAA